MEIKRVTVDFEVKEVKQDDEFFHIMAYSNTWDIDFGGDRSAKGCFAESIKELESKAGVVDGSHFKALMPALWQHDSEVPVGVFVELREDDRGLWSHSIYPKGDSFVRERVIPQVKVGSVRKQSIGYIAEKVSFEEVEGMEVRNLERVKLMESSLVTFPMNEFATILSAKNASQKDLLPIADRNTEWVHEEAKQRARQFIDENKLDIKNHDFIDLVDGELRVVPEGLFLLAYNIVYKGERETNGAFAQVGSYYEKMERVCPIDGKCLIVDAIDVNYLTERHIEDILRKKTNVRFTQKSSKILISNMKTKSLRDAEVKAQREADIEEQNELTDFIKTLKSL